MSLSANLRTPLDIESTCDQPAKRIPVSKLKIYQKSLMWRSQIMLTCAQKHSLQINVGCVCDLTIFEETRTLD